MKTGVLAVALRVAAKELRSALRDRQTVLYTIVLPLALYPAIFWVMMQGYFFLQGRDELTEVKVEVAGEIAATSDERLLEALRAPGPGLSPGPIACTRGEEGLDVEQATARLRGAGDALDAILLLGADPALLVYDGTRSRSNLALERVRERLRLLAEELRREEIERRGRDVDALAAFALESRNVASERELGAYVFSFILPMTFVIMAIMGAFYPAVDLTAGEKERGTSETTLLLPVPRLGIQLGKILSVATSAFVAAVLNLLGLALAGEHLIAAMGQSIDVPWGSLVLAFPLCGAFLFTTSAILLAIASFTDTFKQGQSLIGAVQMVFILPAVVAVMPGVVLTPGLALVPVVQTVLAFKSLLQGVGGQAGLHALAFGSQLVYAALAIWISVRISSREELVSSGASLRRALSLWRTEGTPR